MSRPLPYLLDTNVVLFATRAGFDAEQKLSDGEQKMFDAVCRGFAVE